MRVGYLVLLALAIVCSGCKRSVPSGISDAPDLSEIDSPVVSPEARAALGHMEGKWHFNKQMFIDTLRAGAKTEAEKENVEKQVGLIDMLESRLGQPVHADIDISGTRFTGFGTLIQPQYDITEAHLEGDKVVGKAWFHEDRHDPGDMVKLDLGLAIRDGVLVLESGLEGDKAEYFFTRQK